MTLSLDVKVQPFMSRSGRIWRFVDAAVRVTASMFNSIVSAETETETETDAQSLKDVNDCLQVLQTHGRLSSLIHGVRRSPQTHRSRLSLNTD